MDNLIIRRLQSADLKSITHLQPEGWNDITESFKFYHETPFCYPVVAIANNRIIGTASGISNVSSGWLAHIIVAPDYRNKGIGYRLTEHIIRYLHDLGCNTLLLIATAMGEKLYAKMDFRTVDIYEFYKGEQIKDSKKDPHIRHLLQSDYESVFALDVEISGEQRKQMLGKYLSNGWGYCDPKSEHIRGYFLPELGEGMIHAVDNEAGIALLNFKHSMSSGKAVLPDKNEIGKKFLEEHGFHKYLTGARMVLGEDVPWKPQLVFSRIGGFYG